MADRWQFEKLGMGYRCWNEVVETEFRINRLKRSRGDLSGELSVKTNLANVKTRNGVLHVARFNVLSSSSRSSLAKLLESRTPGLDMDWYDGLEWLCQEVILHEAQGELITETGNHDITPPGQQWMVEPLVLKNRPALLFGPGGVGKSLVALTCGLSVATGREIIPGIVPTGPAPVLYLDWETDGPVINDRIQAIARGHGFKPENMFYRRCVRPLADDAEDLSMIVAERKIVLVIIDSAAYAQGTQGEYGDANEAVLRMHEAIRIIGVTSLIVDHINKTDAKAKGGAATPYGSVYKTNAARISWEVRKAPSVNGMSISLHQAKSNDTAQLEPIGIDLDWQDYSIVFSKGEVDDGSTTVTHEGDTASAIRELLSDGEGMDSAAICRALSNINPATIRSTLSRMVLRSELTKDEAGIYRTATRAVKLRSLPGSKGLDA